MRGVILTVVIMLAAAGAGCARDPDAGFSRLGPSYLGAGHDDDDAPEAAQGASVEHAVRHVKSNKVLGAMAFQKTTGRPIDPSRLSGGQ